MATWSMDPSPAGACGSLKSRCSAFWGTTARWVCLLDGERALWEAQQVYFPEAVGILDLFHVLERLWAVAHCLHTEGNEEAEAVRRGSAAGPARGPGRVCDRRATAAAHTGQAQRPEAEGRRPS